MFKKYPEIIKYTKQIFAHKVGGLVQGQLTPFLIYSFVSLPMVALYTNYTILTQKLEGLISGVINSTGAAIGNLIAEGNKERILKVFRELLAIRIFVASIIGICIYKFASPFIGVWLGSEYILENVTVTIIATLSGLGIARGVLDQFCYGCGLFADVWAPYAESLIMVAFAVAGGYFYGLPGVLCGPLVSIIAIIYIWKPYYLFSRGFKLPILEYWKLFFINILATAASFLVTDYICSTYIQPHIPVDNWLGLIASGAIYAIMITAVTALAYYSLSAGFRDFLHRSKLLKKILK